MSSENEFISAGSQSETLSEPLSEPEWTFVFERVGAIGSKIREDHEKESKTKASANTPESWISHTILDLRYMYQLGLCWDNVTLQHCCSDSEGHCML
jgi:hypothetical protein